jgi:ABC-type dipeptide/oligopeptide/nickel transport system ATPase component
MNSSNNKNQGHQVNDQELRDTGRGAVHRADSSSNPWRLSDEAISSKYKKSDTDVLINRSVSMIRQKPMTSLLSAGALGAVLGLVIGYFASAVTSKRSQKLRRTR